MKKTQISDAEVKAFLTINMYSNSYSGLIKHEYQYDGPNDIDFALQDESLFLLARKDLAIFKERESKLRSRKGFNQGDVIELPDGQAVTISHVWEDSVQTSGNQGSLHLHSCGGVSRSGGLDSGLLKSDLIPTDRTIKQNCWIFHKGSSGAHRGIYFPVSFNVYTVKKGADLSGVPQVKLFLKRRIQAKSETITRINGNGQPYTLHMPEIHLQLKDRRQSTLDINHGDTITLHGLTFTFAYYVYECQPMTKNEIDTFLQSGNFNATFYNNGSYENVLFVCPANETDKKRTTELK